MGLIPHPVTMAASKQPRRKKSHFLKRAIAEFRARPEKERIAREQKRAKLLAKTARDTFKPRKVDRGQIVFVDTSGKRSPAKKGRRGYPVYVTKSGKKWLLKPKKSPNPYRARTKSTLALPVGNRLKKAREKFERARLVTVHRQAITKGSGSVKAGGAHDFNNSISDKIAASVRKTVGSQVSHRIFQVHFNALVNIPGEGSKVISGQVPIEYPDHVAISSIGVKAWVRHKFYSFLARELAYAGYVSSGSANHIRSLKGNKGKPRNKWVDRHGEPWGGRNKEQVEIQKIEWKIEQAK